MDPYSYIIVTYIALHYFQTKGDLKRFHHLKYIEGS